MTKVTIHTFHYAFFSATLLGKNKKKQQERIERLLRVLETTEYETVARNERGLEVIRLNTSFRAEALSADDGGEDDVVLYFNLRSISRPLVERCAVKALQTLKRFKNITFNQD